MNEIKGFFGKYRFLSNFWPAQVNLDGDTYPSVEHAYQAAKTLDTETREKIKECEKPGQAKKLGKKIQLRSDWEDAKLSIMENLVQQKFCNHEDLKNKLLSTGDAYLEETNTWGDRFWGCDKQGKGENHLGKILMRIRDRMK